AGQALGSFADLTGNPFARPSAFPLLAAATESRGNPAVWSDAVSSALWSTPAYLPPGLGGALARNFDGPAWSFEDELYQLSVYYAAESKDLTLADEAGRGRNARRTLEQSYNASWKMGGCADGAGLVWKNVLLRDQIGWDPFKKTFRYFAGLAPADLPATRGDRLKRWFDKLGELSGMDAWATLSLLDRMLIDARYNAPALPAPKALGTLTVATTIIPLATAQWESATARDRPARLRQPNDCPAATAAGPADNALWAYP